MSDVLEELAARRRIDAKLREAEIPFDEMMRRAAAIDRPSARRTTPSRASSPS